jgi:protein pelota
VQNETATGSSSSSRVRTTLTIRVENIDYDTQACMLRLKGRNIVENDYVKVSHQCHIYFSSLTVYRQNNHKI